MRDNSLSVSENATLPAAIAVLSNIHITIFLCFQQMIKNRIMNQRFYPKRVVAGSKNVARRQAAQVVLEAK